VALTTTEDLKANFEAVQNRIDKACRRVGRTPENVTLIAVTKTIDPDIIENAFKLGIRHFGENRVQEAEKKIGFIPPPTPSTWHMIGHLQSNKLAIELLTLFSVIPSNWPNYSITMNDKTSFIAVNISVNSASIFFSGRNGTAFEVISHLPKIEVRGLMTVAPLGNTQRRSALYSAN
jgi:uncharacterized pyridoxal phosphate-containing UPF0001 family protein